MPLNVKLAASRLGVSAAMVYALASARLIAFYRIGRPGRRGKLVFEEKDLDAYLQSCRVERALPGEQHPKPQMTLKHIRLD